MPPLKGLESNGLIRLRMLRAVQGYVQVVDLQLGEVYELTAEKAQQFLDMGVAELLESKAKSKLEAAALANAERRG
jgi:hypothetical protein